MPVSVSIQRILSHLESVNEAENFAVLLRNNGFREVKAKDAAALMEQLARFLPRIRELEGVPTEVVEESSTDSKTEEGSTRVSVLL